MQLFAGMPLDYEQRNLKPFWTN